MAGPSHNVDATPRRRLVSERELGALYELIKGARYASMVMDARRALEDQDFATATRLLESVQRQHSASHDKTTRTIQQLEQAGTKDSQTRARRLQAKHERAESAVTKLNSLVERLQRLKAEQTPARKAPRAAAPAPAAVDEGDPSPTPGEPSALPPEFFAKFVAASTTEAQAEVVAEFFERQDVQSPQDLAPHALYCVQASGSPWQLVRMDISSQDDLVRLQLVPTGQAFKPVPAKKLLELGRRGRLRRLVLQAAGARAKPTGDQATPSDDSGDDPDRVLEMGAFTQLVDAAIRCGLVPNAEMIAHIRDREFRQGHYDRAFQIIEGLYGKFTAAATAREQRLRREEADIKSGRVKMSPKEAQAKRVRDTAETQRVTRARNRFMRVMEGLRVLMRT